MNTHVVSLGDLVLDIILPVTLPVQAAAHQEATNRRIEPGGASNFMIAARHMGLAVSAVAAVGADPFGDVIRSGLDAEGIDTRFVLAEPGSTSTLVMVLTDRQSGEHVYVGSYGSGPDVGIPDGLENMLASAGAVFLQGYSLFEQRIAGLMRHSLEYAWSSGVPIYADAGPYMAYVAPELVGWLVEHAHMLLMTEDEVPFFAGGRTGTAAYEFLLAAGPTAFVVKRGPQGCSIITPQGVEHIPGLNVPVVDTVGAGDCFDAAFIAGRLHGLSLTQSAQLANAMGAAVVGRVGAGRNTPTCSEVLTLLHDAGIEVNYPCW